MKRPPRRALLFARRMRYIKELRRRSRPLTGICRKSSTLAFMLCIRDDINRASDGACERKSSLRRASSRSIAEKCRLFSLHSFQNDSFLGADDFSALASYMSISYSPHIAAAADGGSDAAHYIYRPHFTWPMMMQVSYFPYYFVARQVASKSIACFFFLLRFFL